LEEQSSEHVGLRQFSHAVNTCLQLQQAGRLQSQVAGAASAASAPCLEQVAVIRGLGCLAARTEQLRRGYTSPRQAVLASASPAGGEVAHASAAGRRLQWLGTSRLRSRSWRGCCTPPSRTAAGTWTGEHPAAALTVLPRLRPLAPA
jgi:hypothetical protein